MNQSLLKATDACIMKFTKLTAVAGNVLAELMEVRHTDFMRTVKRGMKDEKNRKSHDASMRSQINHIPEENNLSFNAIFKDWEYQSRGKTFKTYIMNEDALYLVIANMKGQKSS